MPKKLNIFTVSSNLFRVPTRKQDLVPGNSGAAQFVTEQIINGLVKKGHNITLFASGESKTLAKLVPTHPKQTATDPAVHYGTPKSLHTLHELYGIAKCYKAANKEKGLDLIHSHFMWQTGLFCDLSEAPTVSTLHSPLAYISNPTKKIFNDFKQNQYFISLSKAQRRPQPHLQYLANIPHGIDYKKIAWTERVKEKIIVISGRIHRHKGIWEAIQVAKKTGYKLYIFGSHYSEDEYWLNKIKPNINGKNIIYKGFASREEMYKIIRSAKAFLFPLNWEEPFGLVLIEALACGTPVIANGLGSVPEIIDHGKTGFITKDYKEMPKYLKMIDEIDRTECRKKVEEHFNLERMVDAYEKAFYKLT
jgi:glycosyltransferase involved in cell wall biosynthesis